MEKQTPNFFLLLKQGFRGIFKFRIQFIIILILSFLATLTLTISVSTARRLESGYDQVVTKIDPFDYVGSTNLSSTATANAGANMNDYRSLALMDFINNTFVNVTETDALGQTTDESSYNFLLNSQAYSSAEMLGPTAATFLTKIIDQTDQTGFYQLTLKYYQGQNQNPVPVPVPDANTDSYQWDLKESFVTQLIADLLLYRTDSTNPEVSYLTKTSLGMLLELNPKFLDFLPADYVKGDFYHFSNSQKRFLRYLYWISAQLTTWIVNQAVRYEAGPKGIFLGQDGEVDAELPEQKTEVFYEFLTGKTFNGSDPLRPRFVIPSANPETETYVLEVQKGQEWNPDDKGKYLYVIDENDPSTFRIENWQENALRARGFRGNTSPMIIKIGNLDGQGDKVFIKDVTFTNNLEELYLLDEKKVTALTKELQLSYNFSLPYDIMDQGVDWNPKLSWNTRASMMQYHLEFNALSAGFDIRFRKESIIFDNISSRKFRFVFLNGRDNANFTILRGTAPVAKNEVAISQQFAQANKVRVGDYLSVGQALVMVTGIATDAFTFFPNLDPDFPVPQPQTEAFVYGSKETWEKINNGSGEGTSGQNANPQMYTFFLTNNKNQNFYELGVKKELFVALQMDLAKNLKRSYLYLNSLSRAKISQQDLTLLDPLATNSPLESFFSLKDFQSSNYRLSWTLLPLVLSLFQTVTYIASLVIAIIAIIALVICIRKTIAFNSKQIGILKALGTNPWMIAVTYLAHSLIIIGVIIPTAWIVGTGLQIPFSLLFTQYFSAPTNVVLVDWISIVIAFFGFGILALGISILAAYLITRKPVVEIINTSVKWSNSKVIDKMKTTIFKNASFHYRFSLTLASSGKKPIVLLVTVVGLTSLLISGAIAVPAIANTAIDSYYKSVKYANAYENMPPTVNSPLSKSALNFWQGNEVWDPDWIESDLKLDSTNVGYGYYLHPEGYMDSASQSSPIPKYLYFQNSPSDPSDPTDLVSNFTYAYAYLLKYPGRFVDLAGKTFGDNFFTVLGQTFSIGTIDQFFGLVLNSDYETIKALMGADYDENLSLDRNKQRLAMQFSGPLTTSIPEILGAIFLAVSSGGKEGDGTNWKQDVINTILNQVPPYVRTYVNKSKSRLEQFGISFNAETYIPKKETFVTSFAAQTNNYSGVKITGIDANQSAYAVQRAENNRLYLEKDDLAKVQKILDGDGDQVEPFSAHGLKIWDKNNLTLPMLANHQAQAGYRLGKNGFLTNVSTTTRQLKFRSSDGATPWKILPRNAWAYDDGDFRTSDLYQNPKQVLNLALASLPNDQQFASRYQYMARYNSGYFAENNQDNGTPSSWLDVFALENSKFTYKENYLNNQLSNEVYFFSDFAFGTQGNIIASYVRPYYEYKNIKLFLPTELIDEEAILHSSSNSSELGEGTYFNHVKALDEPDKVPNSVLRAWGLKRELNPEFLVINPYDLSYGGNAGKGGLDRLLRGQDYPYWLRYAYDADLGPGGLTYNNEEPVVYGFYNPDKKDFKINFQVVGTIDSYDNLLLLTDANLANMILGFSTARTVGASNTYFDKFLGLDEEHNQNKPRPWPDELNTYTFNHPQTDTLATIGLNPEKLASLTYLKNLHDADNYQPLKWHTGKLSNVEEPVTLTSSISFNVRDNLGQDAISLGYPLSLGVTSLNVNQVLLSTQKALINQIYSLAVSLGALLIIAIVLTASLLIMLVGDVYIAQYLRFMILMRSFGYSNWAIQSYAFGTVTILALIIWAGGTVLAWALIFALMRLIATWGFAVPYGLSWWPILVSFVVIFVSFFGSLVVSSNKVRKEEVSTLMSESYE